MRSIDLIILLLASTANLTIGFLSYLKNYRNLTHKLFALLTVSLVGWTSANYISLASSNPNHVFTAIQAILLFVVVQNTCFFLFVLTYPGNTLHLRKNLAITYLLFSLLVIVVGILPGFFGSYTMSGSSISPQPNPVIGLFIIHTLISIGLGIYRLSRRYRHSNGLVHNQFKFLALASSVLLLIAPFTNFFLPVALNIKVFIFLGPIYTLIFASLIAYSMVKHRLFDFRLLVAKAFAYFLTIGFFALIYTISVFGISTILINFTNVTANLQLIYTIVALLFAFSLHPIKSFFDHATNKLFYKDGYDTQVFLDQLNGVLASTIELEVLLRKSSEIIERNLKSEFCAFSIKPSTDIDTMTIGMKGKSFDDQDAEYIKEFVDAIPQKVIIADDMENTPSRLRTFLSRKDIAILVRLSSGDPDSENLGYLILGYKKSGNPYVKQDIRNIEIIANEVIIAIQNALRFEEIQGFNATLQQKINDATRRLREVNEKLRTLDQTKDEFISMASHQLRTPLTSVKGYLSMVLEGDAGKITKEQRRFLDQAFTSSQRMVYLIADLLNVSRLRTGKFVIEAQPTNLADVVEGEVNQLVEAAKARDLKLIYEKPEGFPVLMLDETKIRQVVMNFVDNAIYYTPSGGHILVTVRETAESIEFIVKDDGLGVPKSEQQHLFTKFYRAGNARSARPDGTGLGLFMAKKVVIAQGGSLIFKSTEGKGSTFGFVFNKAKLKMPGNVDAPENG